MCFAAVSFDVNFQNGAVDALCGSVFGSFFGLFAFLALSFYLILSISFVLGVRLVARRQTAAGG